MKPIYVIALILILTIFLLCTGGTLQAQETELIVRWQNQGYNILTTLRLYQIIEDDTSLIMNNISPGKNTGVLFNPIFDADSVYKFFMTAFDPTKNKGYQESEPSEIATWIMIGDTTQNQPPEGIKIFQPMVKIEFNQYHRYRKFNIYISNFFDETINKVVFELGNCMFDWVHTENKSFFGGENDGIASDILVFEKEIKFGEVVMLDCDIDKSGTEPAFLEDVEGEISVNGHSGILEKDGDNYKCEIRY